MPLAAGTSPASWILNASSIAAIRPPRSTPRVGRAGASTTHSRDDRGTGALTCEFGGRIRKSSVASAHRSVPLSGLACPLRGSVAVLCEIRRWPHPGLPVMDQSRLEDRGTRLLDWLESGTTPSQSSVHRQQWTLPDFAFRSRQRTRLHDPGALGSTASSRLAYALRIYTAVIGDPGRCRKIPRNLLSRCQLDLFGPDDRWVQKGSTSRIEC